MFQQVSSSTAILIFIIISVSIYILAVLSKIKKWSAFILAITLAFVITSMFYNFNQNKYTAIIAGLFSSLIILYVIITAFNNKIDE